jgi:Cu(I)/Ag(I) efflux system membrane protein CusA/SilA
VAPRPCRACRSALAERLTGGRYVDVQIDRVAASRYGLNIADVQAIVAGAVGGENVAETVEGLARFPINLRYPREWRDTPETPGRAAAAHAHGRADHAGHGGPHRGHRRSAHAEERKRQALGWVYVDVRGRDLASVVADLRAAVAREVKLEPGISVAYSGQFEYLERANARLKIVVPATLLIIFVLLYLTFQALDEAVLIMATLPFALTGGVWFLWAMGYHLSIATGVGFIALAGVAAEFGVVMLLYLKHALQAGWPRPVPRSRWRWWTRPSAKAPCCACGPRP